ncbi:MAG: alpha/beta hydrolase family protein, partial [Phenylobacterium sp.]
GLTCAPAAAAQVSFKGGPEELGQELIRRTQSAAYPMFGYDLSEIQEGAARLRSKDPDDWASLWSEFGEKHFAAGRAAERGGNAPLAQREYSAAFDWFSLARWPAPQTTRRRLAYDRSLEAFQAYDRLNDPPLQTLRISFGTQTVTALLRTPKGAGPFPLFIQIGGLDGYKELLARGQSVSLAQAGVATLMLDSPGTGQGVKITPEAWRSLQVTIEAVLRQPDIDAKRVVLWGGSFGGYWATLLAYRMPDAFRGVVAHGGPLGIAEMPLTDEYLFDQDIALTYAVQGARNWTDARRLTRGLNLARSGVLSGRTPPMLLLNGAKDTLVPIADLYAVLR